MKPRYQIVRLARKTKGFLAVIVDNRHPSGVSGLAVRWFASVEDAETHCKMAGAAYEVINQVIKEKK